MGNNAVIGAVEEATVDVGRQPVNVPVVGTIKITGSMNPIRQLKRRQKVQIAVLDEDGAAMAAGYAEVNVGFVEHPETDRGPAWTERVMTCKLE